MKKLFLTAIGALTILFTQAQCQADFSYIQNGPTTIFTDLSTINSGWSTNYSVSWDWDFGDGTTSTLQNPTHTYSNGIYTPCLIVTYFDSTIINGCTSVYCDSILVGNGLPATWDCGPAGCFDPGTGLGQYTTLGSCLSNCGNVTDSFACMVGTSPGITTCVGPGIYTMGQANIMAVYSTMAACIADSCNVMPPPASWDCAPNTPAGCYDPGTGAGQYTTLAACQAVCGTPTPSWECGLAGCYDPGTGQGQYTTLAACQANCGSTPSNLCDSMTASGSQSQIIMEVNNINTIIDYWVTTAPDGTILQEDSITNIHTLYNSNPLGLSYDTIITCINYANVASWYTCCVTWIWNGSFWAKIGSATSIEEINSTDKKLIKIVDILGRDTDYKSNELLFYIYNDGTIEKKYNIK